MSYLRSAVDLLVKQHDEHMEEAYKLLRTGAPPDELAVQLAYGAGLLHGIRTIQSALEA